MGELDGVWKVERVSGVLPPMVGVRKRIRGARGVTAVGPVQVPFTVAGRTLRYHAPLGGLVDYLEPESEGFSGRATVRGREYARFRLCRLGSVEETLDEGDDMAAD